MWLKFFAHSAPFIPLWASLLKTLILALASINYNFFQIFSLQCGSRYMKFQCTSCAEISDHWQYVSLSEEQPKSWQDPKQKRTSTPPRGHVNHTVKCKLCSKSNNLTIMEGSIRPYR